jgi:polyhydroxyalkanoate synthesis regulator phasin
MIDLIKKTLLAGVGAVIITKDKVEAVLDDFVKQGKVSATEAREMADKIADQGRREFDSLSHDLNERLRDRFTSTTAKLQQRIDTLEARVTALELAGSASPSTGTTTPETGSM